MKIGEATAAAMAKVRGSGGFLGSRDGPRLEELWAPRVAAASGVAPLVEKGMEVPVRVDSGRAMT